MDNTNLAYHALFDELSSERPRLLHFIRNRVRDPNDVEDVYQEAMLRLARQIQGSPWPDQPVSYLYRIIINVINDDLRRSRPMDNFDEIDGGEGLPGDLPPPDQQLHDQRCLALVSKELNALPPHTKTIIIMRKLHGMTNIEIARRMGFTAKGVEKQLNRALRAIEASLAKQLDHHSD
nr:sigma-70 family RNA polymerase sigma factor [Microbulbifer celer]